MIARNNNRIRLHLLVIFLVALGLLCSGVRLPDLSRPHRSKQSKGFVLENKFQSSQKSVKNSVDVLAAVSQATIPNDPVSYIPASTTALPTYSSPLLFSNSSRSPPSFT